MAYYIGQRPCELAPASFIDVPMTPADLRATLAGYLRSHGYEQANVTGDWLHRTDSGDIEVLPFEQCVTRELALTEPDTAQGYVTADRYATDGPVPA